MTTPLKVFLSSAQYENEFSTERDILPILFDKHPLKSFFTLWRIEDHGSPENVTKHFLKNVTNSQVIVLLLGANLRKAVIEEWRAALKTKLKCFAFIKSGCAPSTDMQRFIKEEVFPYIVAPTYTSTEDLARKLEDALIETCKGAFRMDSLSTVLADEGVTARRGEAEEERCLRMLVGVLSTEHAQLTRESVLRAAVVNSLLLTEEPLSENDVLGRLSQAMGIKPDSIQAYVHQAIQSLLHDGHIEAVGKNIRPSAKTIADAKAATASSSTRENKLFQSIYSRKNLAKTFAFHLWYRVIRDSVSAFVNANAALAAHACFKGDFNASGIQAAELHKMALAALADVKDLPQGIASWHPFLLDFLQDDSRDVAGWISLQFRAFWSLAVLGCDPSVAEYQRKHLGQYTLYLDSHIALRAMVGAGSDCDVCRSLVQLSRTHKVTMRMAHEIFEEVWHAFQLANAAYLRSGQDIHRAVQLSESVGRRNDVFAGYLREKASTPSITWENYLNRFYSAASRKKTITYMEQELGITVDDGQDFSADEFARIEDITQHLLEKRGMLIDAVTEDARERQYLLRSNEARQMAVTYCHRQRTGVDPRSVWFVTYDTFVYWVSVELAKSGDSFYEFPCYMKPARWLEIVSALSDGGGINTFREILLSPEVQLMATRVEGEVINQMLENRVDLAVKSVGVLREMFADIVCKPAVRDACNEMQNLRGGAALKAAENAKDEIIREMGQQLKSLGLLLKEKDDEIAQAKRTAEKEHRRAKYFRSQASRARSGK